MNKVKRCKATTRSGDRCRNTPVREGYCGVHQTLLHGGSTKSNPKPDQVSVLLEVYKLQNKLRQHIQGLEKSSTARQALSDVLDGIRRMAIQNRDDTDWMKVCLNLRDGLKSSMRGKMMDVVELNAIQQIESDLLSIGLRGSL